MAITILSIGLLVFVGHFLTGFFERTKIPDVLILMLAGILIGPVLKLVSISDFGIVGPVFTTLALVVILFEGGVHLNVKELARSAGDMLFLSVATFALTVLLVTHLADLLLPIDVYTALLIGVIVGGTSSAVVVPLIRILKLADRPATILVMESALTDVLAVVLSLALMRGMQTGFSATVIAGDVAAAFLLAALIGAAGAFVWSAVLPKIRQVPNTVFTTIAYVLILFGLTELWGYSGAIAALSFGIGVANLPNIPQRILGRVITFRLAGFSDVERTFFAEAVFLVKTFFFVFLGISIGFSNTRAVLVGLLLSVVAVLGRLVMVRLLVPRTVTRRHALLMTALIPKGLAAAVLAGMPTQLGLPNGDLIRDTVYAVIFFTILICAVLVFAIESGRLDNLAQGFFGRFATESSGPTPTAYAVPSFDQSLGLPALREEYLEPNIVDLSDHQTPRDDESTPPPPSSV